VRVGVGWGKQQSQKKLMDFKLLRPSRAVKATRALKCQCRVKLRINPTLTSV
jgi:hypothetical protein